MKEENYGFLVCIIKEENKEKAFVHIYEPHQDIAKIMRYNKISEMFWMPKLLAAEHYANCVNEQAIRDNCFLDKDIKDFWDTDRKLYA